MENTEYLRWVVLAGFGLVGYGFFAAGKKTNSNFKWVGVAFMAYAVYYFLFLGR